MFDYIALENFVLRLSKSEFVGYPIPELLGSPPGENVPDQIHRINLSISVFILSYAVFLIVISYLKGSVLQFKALGCAILIPLFAGVVLFWLRFNAGDHIVSKSEKAELFEFSFYSIATCLVLFFFVFRKSKQAVRTNENLVEKTASRAPENIQVVAPGKAELPAEGEQASADIESSQTMDESNEEISIKQVIERRKNMPEPVRDGLHDLHNRMEELSSEMKIIKKMIEDQTHTSK